MGNNGQDHRFMFTSMFQLLHCTESKSFQEVSQPITSKQLHN